MLVEGDQGTQNNIVAEENTIAVVPINHVNPHDHHVGGVGIFFMMLMMMGTRIGGGLVGVPYATDRLGYVFAICFQLLYFPCAVLSCWMILSVRDITGRASLPAQGTYAYGNISIYLINSLIALAQLGFPIIFLIVFGDVAGNLLQRLGADENSFWVSRWFTQTLLGVLLFYLILKKEIHNLKYTGLVVL